jgi:hypothetical protein
MVAARDCLIKLSLAANPLEQRWTTITASFRAKYLDLVEYKRQQDWIFVADSKSKK